MIIITNIRSYNDIKTQIRTYQTNRYRIQIRPIENMENGSRLNSMFVI